MVFTSLFDLPNTPPNIKLLKLKVFELVNFDIFDTGSYLIGIFNFYQSDSESDERRRLQESEEEKEENQAEDPTPPLNKVFEEAGFETSNFVLNMGSAFVFELIYIVIFISLPLLKYTVKDAFT
jgi:hypothetical protein